MRRSFAVPMPLRPTCSSCPGIMAANPRRRGSAHPLPRCIQNQPERFDISR